MSQAPHTAPLRKDDQLQVGDRVVVDKDKNGQVKWIGEHQVLGTGKHYGIRLTEKRGLCNGTYKEVKFFWCPDNYGVLVPANRITGRYLDADFDFRDEKEPVKVDPAIEQIRQKRKEIQNLKKSKKKKKNFFLNIKKKEYFGDLYGNDEQTCIYLFTYFFILKKKRNFEHWTKVETCSEGLFPKMTTLEVKKLFEEIDVTKSGKISFAEFDAWVQSLGGIHVMEHKDFAKIRQQFIEMDINKDKKISLEEFSVAFQKVFPKLSKVDVTQLFREIDASGNGTIEFSEFDAWVKLQEL
ncbi:hypothetical protein RFI_07002 [Reticulomyxa filosa]|uniref:EF-hand domain-containing protein n=1 Tax=Reticulomyxa filosa TaxID=46433 RepID=X6NWB5_RETFI|nr:hypothetical protein RFI_07002 [Reticulomyxa filosa]|eukprot:ETO30119.1 hypothetical protein RFI_07002 [Reticulomyxa filosa]